MNLQTIRVVSKVAAQVLTTAAAAGLFREMLNPHASDSQCMVFALTIGVLLTIGWHRAP